ncbi:amino acid ABC transporter permease [Proteinivorax hydrogeniformans]|uniref:Amino acid ABC transporter permease n=1 Tax=Proteinivorax hydrogeniformans TaxID=1826727 RepID=A0AAU8HTY7_9FIRM
MISEFIYSVKDWFSFLFESFALYPDAIMLTFQITAIGILLGTVLGLFFAFLKISKFKVLNILANAYISIIRGTPLLLQIIVFYNVVRIVINFGRMEAAAFALAVHNGAYIAEIFRGSIESISKGQMEAARSLGMTHWQAMRRIILPQAFKRAIPPLANQFSIALKDSSLATVIGVREILQVTRTHVASAHDLRFYLTAGLIYWVLTTVITYIVRVMENKFFSNER